MGLSTEQLGRDELGTLYTIARTLNSTRDFDQVLQIAMDRVIEFVGADRGFLVLVNQQVDELKSELKFEIARNSQEQTIDKSEFEISLSTVKQVVSTRTPLTHADPPASTESILTHGIRSIMCAPLVVRDKCIGAVYVDRRTTTNPFGAKQYELLLAFCHQAAIAIDNARLFADLAKTIRQVKEDKQYRDNIFSSIANGVITTNASGRITLFNHRAGIILNLNPQMAIGKHYQEVFCVRPELGLTELLQNAMTQHQHDSIVPSSIDCEIPGRHGPVNLNFYVSSLRDEQGAHIGMALVIDDRTELKRSEAEAREIRRIFNRYVPPSVVEQLIENPKALNLGGETKEISVIFADIRGYTKLSESMASESEKVMTLLNNYLDIMVKEIWDEGGTLTAFQGDALMAIFNAPLLQQDHALRAVRAAWKMRRAIREYQKQRTEGIPISYGIGVNTGQAVVGNLGSQGYIQNYTAIGDVVNIASRLQSNASDNNILLTYATFTQVSQYVTVVKHPTLYPKNHSPVDVGLLTRVAGLPY